MPSNAQDNRPVSILKSQPQSQECVSPSSYLGLNNSVSPKSTPKSVSIAPEAEVVSPLMLGNGKSVENFQLEENPAPWRMSVKGPNSRKLSGRPAYPTSPSLQAMSKINAGGEKEDTSSSTHLSKHVDHVIEEVASWLKDQRARRARRKGKKTAAPQVDEKSASRRLSDASIASDDFDRLEDIIKYKLGVDQPPRKLSYRRRPSLKKRISSTGPSSDTEYYDGDIIVPSCDAILDNSKTLAYTGGAPNSDDEASDEGSDELSRRASYRDIDAWTKFKFEIVRLTHTLRLKGWRRVALEACGDITVERLSGALTNAVYVVLPPENLEQQTTKDGAPKRQPQKLLLRIYGPQVEHLIDREAELAILQRLSRKRIGPRMLGTFTNGRFEEFFNARTLTPEDLRNADTSQQIAKRMRELHDGIELLEEERNSGPFVWRNWDKWEQRVEQIVTWLDDQIRAMKPGVKPTGDEAWKRRSFICGVEWKHFKMVVEKYRAWLNEQYGGQTKCNDELVFAHNDTQYGNILRIVPSGESPLLLPANTHKQLVVIDFEYANANHVGLEFANHFTEWCYNYHDKRKPYACNTGYYPTVEEQERFIRAYVKHRPLLTSQSSEKPGLSLNRSSSSLTTFMLDARNPQGTGKPQRYDENAETAAEDAEIKRLLHDTRLWRLANTAQWVAWGIVQAKVPGMPDFGAQPEQGEDVMEKDAERAALEDLSEEYEALAKDQSAVDEEEQEEFDYLGYAQHRAMFFWGDAIQLGFAKLEDFPEDVQAKIKTVLY